MNLPDWKGLSSGKSLQLSDVSLPQFLLTTSICVSSEEILRDAYSQSQGIDNVRNGQ